MAQLWRSKILKYSTLIINQHLLYKFYFCLKNNNCAILYIILKNLSISRKEKNFSCIEMIINISIKIDKIKKLIDLRISNEKIYDIVQIIHIQVLFPLKYNERKKSRVKRDYLD